MPAYPWLLTSKIDVGDTAVKMTAMKKLRVPYSSEEIGQAAAVLTHQAKSIASGLNNQGASVEWNSELVALISYLQRLGKLESRFESSAAQSLNSAED